MSYKYTCRYCGSKFSLSQQLEEHELACGRVGDIVEGEPAKAGKDGCPCKYCGKPFDNFGDYGRHRWQVHRAEVLAELARKREQKKTDEKKIDRAIAGENGDGVPAGPRPKPRGSNGAVATHGGTCPTCGGILPATTAQLVRELAAAGIPEAQAFEAARIARRVLVAGAA